MKYINLNKKTIKAFIVILVALIISYIYPTSLNKNENNYFVSKVIDGDTIELNSGQRLRYIGIDSPEINYKGESECFAQEAKEFNKKLVEKKGIKIEKDVSEKDKFGRLLRYVFIDGVSTSSAILVNEYLVRQGYAIVSTYPPDVKYIGDLLLAQQEARENSRGFWKECE